ncbi:MULTISPECIES: hypothetical protein [Bacillaceae]|uniref:hypothetical protein n=1 Tax=Bacillaceae TaxID=186817 RepID=UPI002FFE595F
METLILFIVIGILSAIFGKNSKQVQKSKPFVPKRMEDVRTLFESVPPKTAQVEQDNAPVTRLEEQYFQTKAELEDAKIPIKTPEKPIGRMRMTQKAEQKKEQPVPIDSPDSQTVLNGIIWSEILGEPRSKKPHFSGRR